MTLDTRQSDLAPLQVDHLIGELRQLIDQARESIATTVNAKLTMLYWQIGNRIYKEILNEDRAAYGKAIVASVSQQLTTEYGKSFNEKNLRRMIQFAEIFSDPEIVVSLIRHLSWTHFIALIPIKDAIKRDFYAEMCRLERWNVKTLRKKIDSMLFERTALSKKPDSLIRAEVNTLREEDRLSPDLVFRDPYFLDFLKLNDRYFERDIEDAIMRELEQFLLEIGTGFCFLARQKRITVDNIDFYIDLLFFHRDLNRLVVIELKLGDFKPEHKGQLELYLRWLDKYERRPSELAPMGLLLCTGKNQEQIELLELGQAGIHVAEYLTVLPPKEVLKDELHKAVEQARKRLQADSEKEEES